MLRSAELAHKRHTNSTKVPAFWNALQEHEADAYRDLLRTSDVEAWAVDHHLHRAGVVPAWLLEDAQHEREYFLKRGGSKGVSLLPRYLHFKPVILQPHICGGSEDLAFGCYDPISERRKDAKERITAELEEQLDAEMDRIEREAGGGVGYKDDVHMRRFVRFQVAKVKVRDLIRDESEQPKTNRKDPDSAIRKSLKATAIRLSVTLRQDRRGAPRK